MKLNKGEPCTGINTDKAMEKIQADHFLGEFQILDMDGNWSNQPVAMFHSITPDLTQNHKPFPYLFIIDNKLMIGGLSEEQMEKVRFQEGMHCTKCDDVIYSRFRHDFRHCTCKNIAVDGGRDYMRVLITDPTIPHKHGIIDFVNGSFNEEP